MSMWFGSLIISAAYIGAHMTQALTIWFPGSYALSIRQSYVDFWPKSYILGIIIALNIYGFNAVSAFGSKIIVAIEGPIRILANASFGIYAIHYPLGLFFKALLWHLNFRAGAAFIIAIYLLTFFGSFLFGLLCDPLRIPLRKFLNRSTSRALTQAAARP